MSEDVKLNAYFERIGFAGSIAPTLQTLNSVLGLPVPLDQASLNHKLLTERRGGYCFEQNLMLLRVLRDLGFTARGHLAKVLWGRRDVEGLTTDHMMMTADVGGVSYLADVGFGGLLLTAPLKLKTEIEQEVGGTIYRLTGEEPVLRLEVKRDDTWWPAYEFDLAEVDDAGFEARNRDLNADPEWFLHHHLLLEICAPGTRRSLYDTRLTTTSEAGVETRTLSSVPEMRETLTTLFNMNLPAAEGLDAAFGRILTRNLVSS